MTVAIDNEKSKVTWMKVAERSDPPCPEFRRFYYWDSFEMPLSRTDLDIDQMRSKVSEFSAALSDSKSAVIYYAGHGISVDEENYLVPTDIVVKSPTDLDLNAISVSLLLKQMKRVVEVMGRKKVEKAEKEEAARMEREEKQRAKEKAER